MKLKLSDLWIGDEVIMQTSKQKGKYIGQNSNGKLRIQVNDKVFLTSINNISKVEDQPEFFDIDAFLSSEEANEKAKFENNKGKSRKMLHHTIDLHIEILAPEMNNLPSGQILAFQLETFKEFLNTHVEKGTTYITVIHGKGQGVLKEAILNLLKEYPLVKMSSSKNHGGAMDIWF
ncbi:MAG: Smr/MutS family protein [Lewinellaceae bacterium]|nr:Smr/MutS family protein [Lewinellaceae bacterium]